MSIRQKMMTDSGIDRLISALSSYEPFNEQEAADRDIILSALSLPDIFCRTNRTQHITASAWVTDSTCTRVLMAYHNIYKSWSWLGGHADGETDLPSVAVREVREESGITSVRLVSDDIFSLEVLTVDGHIKRGIYVPSHLHLNITYLLQADDSEATRIKADENSAVGWFYLDDAVNASDEPWFRENVYQKLNRKLRALRNDII